jgi:hypothetical protein
VFVVLHPTLGAGGGIEIEQCQKWRGMEIKITLCIFVLPVLIFSKRTKNYRMGLVLNAAMKKG